MARGQGVMVGKGKSATVLKLKLRQVRYLQKIVSERIHMFAETQYQLGYLIEICKYLINKEVAFMI